MRARSEITSLSLRSYQRRAVERVVSELSQARPNDRNRAPWVLCALPTGSGKTLVGVVAAAKAAGKGSVIWLAHQQELLDRAHEEKNRAVACGVIPGDVFFEFITVQRFMNLQVPPSCTLIVFDEAHHLHSDQRWISDLRRRRRPVLGLTATPRRSFSKDGWRLAHYVARDELTPHHLAAPVPITERTGITPTHVGQKLLGAVAQMDFDSETYKALDTDERNRLVADYLAKNASTLAPMLVYVSRIEHAERLAQALQRRDVSAAFVHGETSRMSRASREEIFDRFRRGRISALVNVNLVSEGVDLPELRSVVMAVPTISDIRFAQMLGRGCRKTEKKKYFHLVDFVDNLGAFEALLDGRHLFNGVTARADRYDPSSRKLADEYRFEYDPPDQPYLAALRKALTFGFLTDDQSSLLAPDDIEGHLLKIAKRHHMPLSSDGRRPREVPFVHEFVFPFVKEAHPDAGVRKEVLITEGMRCDILIRGNPTRIIEFAAGRVNSSKAEQLEGYRKAFKREVGGRVEATLVATSLNGSTRSREFSHGRSTLEFVNWHDFIRDITARVDGSQDTRRGAARRTTHGR